MQRTPLSQLPELQDDRPIPDTGKFIRNFDNQMPMESGMNSFPVTRLPGTFGEGGGDSVNYQGLRPILQPQEFERNHLSCLVVGDHVSNCKICQHYYGSRMLLYLNVFGLIIIILIIWKQSK